MTAVAMFGGVNSLAHVSFSKALSSKCNDERLQSAALR